MSGKDTIEVDGIEYERVDENEMENGHTAFKWVPAT